MRTMHVTECLSLFPNAAILRHLLIYYEAQRAITDLIMYQIRYIIKTDTIQLMIEGDK